MPSTVLFWSNWLWTAAQTMPEFLGNNWVGALFACVLIFLYERRNFFSLDRFQKATTRGERLRALRDFLTEHWTLTLKLWAVVLVIFFIGHTLDLVCKNDQSLQKETSDQSTKISTDAAACIADKSNLKIVNAGLVGENKILANQNRDQQGTINNCQTQAIKLLSPAKHQATMLLWKGFDPNTASQETEWLMITNTVVTPFKMTVTCNQKIDELFSGVVGGPSLGAGSNRLAANSYSISWDTPPWTPEAPYRVTMKYTGTKPIGCRFEEK